MAAMRLDDGEAGVAGAGTFGSSDRDARPGCPSSNAGPGGQGPQEAVYVFGIHKCGSTLLHDMVGAACEQAGIPKLSLPRIAFQEGVDGKVWGADQGLIPTFQQARVFYGFRFLPEVLRHSELKIRARKFVLLVRDPRDALVSQYFSYGGKHLTHRLPENNPNVFLDRIMATADLDIDAYVLDRHKRLLSKMRDYWRHLDFSKGLVRRYEDIFFDKRGFLAEIFEHLGLEIAPEIVERVADQHDVRPAEEDPTKHIRKGTPGDHREKLKPETIERLNDVFFDIASAFGYRLGD